jgi:hypothetical protein
MLSFRDCRKWVSSQELREKLIRFLARINLVQEEEAYVKGKKRGQEYVLRQEWNAAFFRKE